MLIITACGLLGTVVLAVLAAAAGHPTGVDAAVHDALVIVLGEEPPLLELLVLPSEPPVLLPLLVLVCGVCLGQRRAVDAWFAAGTVLAAVTLNTLGTKPVVGLLSDGALSYPSGHTVSIVTTLGVLCVLARPGTATVTSAALTVALTAAAGGGMIVLGYHTVTEIVGGALFGIAAVAAGHGAACGWAGRHRSTTGPPVSLG